MIYTVVFLQHHKAFVTLKGFLCAFDTVCHLCLDVTFFGLEFVCSLIEGENEEVYGKAQEYYR